MKSLFLLISFLIVPFCFAKTVRYELIATKGQVNLSGKKTVDFALKLNGSIPAPVLEFTEGDDAEITLINQLPTEEISIHWHGILLDPYMDGVPYVNTPPIRPGEKFTYKIKLRQHGTFWYHSHTNVQEQKGLYGAFIIHPKEKKVPYDKDLVLVLSDWSDEDSLQILANLRKDGDYYIYKKGTMRSWWGALKTENLWSYLKNEWTRMGGMDLSDVGYDSFLINGKNNSQGIEAHAGEKIRLRIINAAASTYFHVKLGNLAMKIISLDGIDIKPTYAKEFQIGMAETYDVLFEIPEHKNYELRAIAQDGTGSASSWIGMGEKVFADPKRQPDQYAPMNHDPHSEMDHSQMDHSTMDHSKMKHEVLEQFDVTQAEAQTSTAFPSSLPRHDVKLLLDGDMDRYIWLINGKAIHQDRTIEIKQNDVVRFTFINKTMMHHPMHLHGHFFRVLNKKGETSPLKHTVDVAPHTTRIIEFKADEPGDWMLHCHNLYHLKTGMARVVKYSSFTPRKDIQAYQKLDPHRHDHLYYKGMIEAATNHAQAQFNLMNTWDEMELRTEYRDEGEKNWELEGDLFYKRWFGRFTHLMAGATMVEGETAAVAGVGYILPMLVETHLMMDQKTRLRLDLEKRFQWTKTIYTDAEFTLRQRQPSEFEITLMYQDNWAWSAGLMFTENSAGVGAQYNF